MIKRKIPISVIVPNYNSGNYLTECIESINAGLWPVEIIIIDDCSDDGSFELAKQLQLRYSNIRLSKLALNGGAANARRVGLANVTQNLIAMIDADDLIEAGALQDAYEKIESCGADMCIWDLWGFDEMKKWRHGANPSTLPVSGNEAVLLTLGGWRIHAAGVYRKNLYESAYKNFNQTAFNADELITRLVFSQATEVVGSQKKYFYRMYPSSTSHKLSIRRLSSLQSHLWLLNFARHYPNGTKAAIVRSAVGEAYFYWTKRKDIGLSSTLKELKIFLFEIYLFRNTWALIWRSPKHSIALLILSVAVWFRV